MHSDRRNNRDLNFSASPNQNNSNKISSLDISFEESTMKKGFENTADLRQSKKLVSKGKTSELSMNMTAKDYMTKKNSI